jgi:hypothetical protein
MSRMKKRKNTAALTTASTAPPSERTLKKLE